MLPPLKCLSAGHRCDESLWSRYCSLNKPITPEPARFYYRHSISASFRAGHHRHHSVLILFHPPCPTLTERRFSLCLCFGHQVRLRADGPMVVKRYLFSLACPLIFSDGGEDCSCLLPPHHGDPGVWPHVQEPRADHKYDIFIHY